jgi:hypothetical protein
MRRLALAVVLFAFVAVPVQAETPRPGVGMIVLDVAVVRPLSVVGSLASTALSIGTLPITFPIGVADESTIFLIHAPWRFTAARVPGSFSDYEDGGDVLGP